MTDRVIREAVKLKRSVHIVVALGHCGYDFDVELAASPVIDAVVGGHTHLVRHRSSFNDRPVVLQAGAAASHLGVLRLSLARRKGNVTVASARSATRRRE
jgi:2',3'-cyclic-nucleotide 2'-phosphodiesterase (5'-nucleotidase family)